MENWILTVGCPMEQFIDCQKEWLKYNILLCVVKSVPDAVTELSQNNYLLLSICANEHNYLPYLKLIREMKPIPILIAPSHYNAAEKIEAIDLGADSYMEMPLTVEECVATGWALIRRYTELNIKKQEHISIIANKNNYLLLRLSKGICTFNRSEFDPYGV